MFNLLPGLMSDHSGRYPNNPPATMASPSDILSSIRPFTQMHLGRVREHWSLEESRLHKCPEAQSGSPSNLGVHQASKIKTKPSPSMHGQQHYGSLYQSEERDPLPNPASDSIRSLVLYREIRVLGSSISHIWGTQRGRRYSRSPTQPKDGMDTKCPNLPASYGKILHARDLPICFQTDPPSPDLYLKISRPMGDSSRCISLGLESVEELNTSSSERPTSSHQKDSKRQSISFSGSSELAWTQAAMVLTDPTNVCRLPTGPPQVQTPTLCSVRSPS